MADWIGKKLNNRYYVRELLGQGGMADVYKTWDKDRGVSLALKVLKPNLASDPNLVKRFRIEGKVLANLQHPNIVRYYGFESEYGVFALVMDFIEGTTLKEEMKSTGKCSLQRIVQIMRPVCTALNYAHRKGVIHCDIKPANIMLHTNGTVLLADFGIAQIAAEAGGGHSSTAGTASYMAPEQVRGKVPTPQTDIYALGVVLFEMVAGFKPFDGNKAPINGSQSEKLRWEQVNSEAPSLLDNNPSMSPALNDLVLSCLNKDPRQRPASALALIAQLESIVQSNPEPGQVLCKRCGKPIQTGRSYCENCEISAEKKEHHFQAKYIVLGMVVLGIILTVVLSAKPKPPFSNEPNITLDNVINPTITIIQQESPYIYIPQGMTMNDRILISLCNWSSFDDMLDITLTRPDGAQRDQVSSGDYTMVDCADGNEESGYQIWLEPDPAGGELPGSWSIQIYGMKSGYNAKMDFYVSP